MEPPTHDLSDSSFTCENMCHQFFSILSSSGATWNFLGHAVWWVFLCQKTQISISIIFSPLLVYLAKEGSPTTLRVRFIILCDTNAILIVEADY